MIKKEDIDRAFDEANQAIEDELRKPVCRIKFHWWNFIKVLVVISIFFIIATIFLLLFYSLYIDKGVSL